MSLAEHLYPGVGLVDVDGELIELLDELLDVLRFELGEVDRYPGPGQLCVDLGEGLWRDEAGEPDPGAQQLQRDPDVDPARTVVAGVILRIHHDAQVLGSGFRAGRGSWGRLGLSSFEGVDQPLGVVRSDIALSEHLKDLAAL